MSLQTVASVIGIASGANSLFGGNLFGGNSGGTGPGGATYVPQNRPGIDANWQQVLSQIMPLLTQQAGNISGPVNTGYQATLPGNQWGGVGNFFQQAGNQLQTQANQAGTNEGLLSQAGYNTYQTALDPQNALRNQLQQQVTDASRAGTSMRGIGMSGEAAGIENQDVNNFLIQWQNQQLGRQLAGLQGMGGAMNAGVNQGNLVNRSLGGEGQMYTTGMDLPFATANSYSSAFNPLVSQFGTLSPQMLNYLGLSNSSTGALGQAQGNSLAQLASGLQGLSNSGTQPPAPITDYSTQAPGT